MVTNRATPDRPVVFPDSAYREADTEIGHGSVLIAAITSCTNTSNPSVMLGAALLAKKAVELGLKVNPAVKTSLGPGSRVVTDYLEKTGLQPYLDKLGFKPSATAARRASATRARCIPRSRKRSPRTISLPPACFPATGTSRRACTRTSSANFLMSPPLVVAFALAGTVDIDLSSEPLGKTRMARPFICKEIWPTLEEIRVAMESALKPEVFRKLYTDFAEQNPKWNEIPSSTGDVYEWDRKSTYIQEPPFFVGFRHAARPHHRDQWRASAGHLRRFGHDRSHLPRGRHQEDLPGWKFLLENGVPFEDFNSYGSRRGNDRVMTRGTFANVRIKNLMVPGVEGGYTLYFGDGKSRRQTRKSRPKMGSPPLSTTPAWPTRLTEFHSSSSPARSMEPARAVTGPPRAPNCWA